MRLRCLRPLPQPLNRDPSSNRTLLKQFEAILKAGGLPRVLDEKAAPNKLEYNCLSAGVAADDAQA